MTKVTSAEDGNALTKDEKPGRTLPSSPLHPVVEMFANMLILVSSTHCLPTIVSLTATQLLRLS